MLSEKSLCYYFNVATSELAEPRGSDWSYGHAERERTRSERERVSMHTGWARTLSAQRAQMRAWAHSSARTSYVYRFLL